MVRIDVVDNAGQFTHLERRALRELGVESDLIDNETPAADVTADGLVLSGGPGSAYEDGVGGNVAAYLELGVPVLGICLGMQTMATALGGTVGPGEYGGYADVTVAITDPDDQLVGSLAPETRVWTSHADEVKAVPEGFSVTATSDVCEVEAMSDPDRALYGVQWHPEVEHTAEGMELLENFLSIVEERR